MITSPSTANLEIQHRPLDLNRARYVLYGIKYILRIDCLPRGCSVIAAAGARVPTKTRLESGTKYLFFK